MEDSKNPALAPTRTRHKPSAQSKNAKWTSAENDHLTKLVAECGQPNWNELTNQFPGKTPQQIAERWEKVLNPLLVKGSWTREEDMMIMQFVNEKGTKDWTKLATLLPGRIGKQCRERWRNHLDPGVNREPWTEQEDNILIDMYEKMGSKWVKIADHLPGRSDNAIKNRWNSTLKKRLEYQKNGLERPKRGRPSQKNGNQRPLLETKPKSADDIPKPPKFDDIPAIVRGPDSAFDMSVLTPQLSVPFSPMMPSSPGFKLWSPSQDMGDYGNVPFYPHFFSPKDDKEDSELRFGLGLLASPHLK
jgi:hypothetical protein